MSVATRIRAAANDRLLTAADTWERHLIVADLLGDARQVVDVGGLPGQLRAFLPGASVIAVNVVPPTDLVVDPDHLPFSDAAIEAVTSLDALEHVPPDARAGFVAELVRVASRRVVLCCPLGTPEHVAAELEVEQWYRSVTGEDHPWLVEHREFGLPTADEIAGYAEAACPPGTTWRLAFHGDFRVTNSQFRQIVLARHRPRPGGVASFISSRVMHVPDVELRPEPGPYTNRVFLIVDRSAG